MKLPQRVESEADYKESKQDNTQISNFSNLFDGNSAQFQNIYTYTHTVNKRVEYTVYIYIYTAVWRGTHLHRSC